MPGSLRLRLALLISLAVLPLGLIAVQQSVRVIQDAIDLEEQDILFRTVQAAASEQELFREAFGAAAAIGVAALEVGPDTAACDRIMARLVERSATYVFAGFLSPQGRLTCSFDGSRADFSETEGWQDFIENPRDRLTINRQGAISGQSVVIATVPVFDRDGGDLLGATAVSVPHTVADWLLSAPVDGLSIALVDRDGRVLSTSKGIDAAGRFDALGIVPGAFEMDRSGTTRIVTAPNGEERLIALAPVFDRDIFVLGIWDNGAASYAGPNGGWLATVFPILMWITALVVAMLALERLVLRHLRHLRSRMRKFSPEDPSDVLVDLDDVPAEIAEIAQSYNRMVARILSDRAALTRNVAEKELLLREVHHRIKNNLQLITSILNMQIRSLSAPREQALLRRVQARVMSLSVVHRALYEGNHVGPIRADLLLRTVLEATFRGATPGGGAVRTAVEADEVILDADQAVPLALLAAEAVTNAIKFVGHPPQGAASIDVALRQEAAGRVTLAVSNTAGPRLIEPADAEISGLGSRLIEGFAAQLDAEMETRPTADSYTLSIHFQPLDIDAGAPDEESLAFYGAAPTAQRAEG